MAVGWCIEWLQAYFLVADDIMDESITRRGQPCWYKARAGRRLARPPPHAAGRRRRRPPPHPTSSPTPRDRPPQVPKVGMVAVNDGILLEAAIYKILKKHAAGLPCYLQVQRRTRPPRRPPCPARRPPAPPRSSPARRRSAPPPRREITCRRDTSQTPRHPPQLIELFHDTTYQTATGQLLDLITAPIGVVDLTKYTLPTYMRIVTYKTAFYTFYLPAAAALHLCGREAEEGLKVAKDICVRLGQFFQIQDDYLDCYGDPKVIGKVGTDIEDNKCSWLIVQALDRASAEQRKVIEENYGKKDHAHVAKIKQLYRDLDLEASAVLQPAQPQPRPRPSRLRTLPPPEAASPLSRALRRPRARRVRPEPRTPRPQAVYKAYEEKSYGELKALIEGQSAIPEKLFSEMLAKIYKRQK